MKQIFKKYPDNDPDFKGIHYLTITDRNIYSFTYFNDNCEWESEHGEVLAFCDVEPNKILKSL